VTDKGAARKKAILAAARDVFEDKGFIDTRVSDIVKKAGVSHGTYYTYYDTKETGFEAVARATLETMIEGLEKAIPSAEFGSNIRGTIELFVELYRPNAVILGMIKHLGTDSDDMRTMRLQIRDIFVNHTLRGIETMQNDGEADPDLDLEYTAEALVAALEHSCYMAFCLQQNYDLDRMVSALAMTWTKALKKPTPSPAA
jgi:AcrR family transcriptional regulator